jgi:hypothetical protein
VYTEGRKSILDSENQYIMGDFYGYSKLCFSDEENHVMAIAVKDFQGRALTNSEGFQA